LFLPFWYRLTRVVPEKGPLNVLNMIKQDSQKNNKFDATRCQMLRQNAFDFRWGSAPDTTRGAYIAPPDALAVFKEAYF